MTAKLLHEVCQDVQLQTTLQPLTGEGLFERSAITTEEARYDVSTSQVAFLDVRVINPNSNRYVNHSLKKTYKRKEKGI